MDIYKHPFGWVVSMHASKPCDVGSIRIGVEIEAGKFRRGLSKEYRSGFELNIHLGFLFISLTCKGNIKTYT